MWRPRSYQELHAALGVVAEGPQVDFKRVIASNPNEIAKDVAAMTIDGGVLVYGADEHNGVASALVPVPLQGARERIQQIVDSAIRPVPAVEMDVITVNAGDNHGFIVVFVPPSPLAPHEANDRFPARSDTTTRYLGESEIERLYEQRRRLLQQPNDEPALACFLPAEGGLGPSNSFGGIAVERLVVAPVAPLRHPQGAWLGRPLEDAFSAAVETVSQLVAPQWEPKSFDFLQRWAARGTVGWAAGSASDQPETLKQGVLVAATYSYEGHFSFVVTMSVMAEDDIHRQAFENLWVAETLAMLSLAGHFLAERAPLLSTLRWASKVSIALLLRKQAAVERSRQRRGRSRTATTSRRHGCPRAHLRSTRATSRGSCSTDSSPRS